MAARFDLADGGAAHVRLDPGTTIASLTRSLSRGSVVLRRFLRCGRAAHPLPDGDGAGRSASGQETEEDYGCSIPATLLLEPAPECLPTPPLLDVIFFYY
ncbi:unnamed protein product [Urochloa humidicola]